MNSTLAPVTTLQADSARAAEENRPAANALVATVRMVADARGLALGVLAALALVFALSWAQTFLVPLLLGIVIAYTLNPLVVWLEAIKIPRVAGTIIIMASVIGALVLGTYSLRGEMQTIIEQLPEAAAKVSTAIERVRIAQRGSMQRIQNAATEVEQATHRPPAVPWRRVSPPPTCSSTRPHSSSATSCGRVRWALSERWVQAAIVVFLIFFLLLGGDQFKRKLVQLTGPSLSNKRITVHILDDINGSIQKCMFMLLTTNLLCRGGTG